MICIVDYGAGNIGSVRNMLRKLGLEVIVSSQEKDLRSCEKLILPGVGSFDYAMHNLKKSGLYDLLNELVLYDQKPILGVCLGMHLMTRASEEGVESGLGWIEADVKRFTLDDLPVPHMGWNYIKQRQNTTPFQIDDFRRFYFAHSYYVDCDHQDDIFFETVYGHSFVSAFRRKNIMGVQFHPEKSHMFGKNLFRFFCEL